MPKRSFTLEDIDKLPTWFSKAAPQTLIPSDKVFSLFEYASREALLMAMRRGLFPRATKKLDVAVSSGTLTRLFWSKKDLMNYILTLIV